MHIHIQSLFKWLSQIGCIKKFTILVVIPLKENKTSVLERKNKNKKIRETTLGIIVSLY